MNKYLLFLLLLFPSVASAQFPMLAAWQTAASGFSPTQIDSLKGWYVAKDIADSLGKASGDTLWRWPNRAKWLSTNALADFIQATDARKPIYRSDSNVVVLDVVDDMMNAAAGGSYAQPGTFVVVCKFSRAGEETNVLDGTGTSRHALYWTSAGTSFNLYAGSVAIGFVRNKSIDTTYIMVGIYNGASSTLRTQGIQSSTLSVGTQALAGLSLGNFNNTTNRAGFSVAEVLYYHKALSVPECASLETYLAAKYGTTLP